MIDYKMNLSLEDRLLSCCAQLNLNDKKKNIVEEILQNNLNWQYILEKSKTELITCLLYNNLLQFQHRVPDDILNTLKEIYYANIYQNTRAYQQLSVVLSSFNKRNLKVIPLKGVFLAEKVYNNIALRVMNDIDLLIKKDELQRIDKLLESLGYRISIHKDLLSLTVEKSYLNSVNYFKSDKKTLHVHWHIVNISLPTYLYTRNIKMDKFWESSEYIKLSGMDTLQLAPHHLIMCLAEHALKHSFNNLMLFSDIDATVKRYGDLINWNELIKDTIKFGMERQVFYSLYFTNYFLETDISDDVLARLKPKKNGFLEKRFFYSVSNNKRDTKLCYFVYLNIVKGIINKFRFVFRTFFPPPCVLALYFNLNSPKATIKDYFLFLRKQFFRIKSTLTIL